MVKRFLGLSLVLFLIMAPQAYAWDVEVALGGWQQNFGGTLGYNEILTDDYVLDIDRDFNFDEENRLFGRARLDLPLFFPNLYVVAAPMSFESTGSKSVAIEYGDLSIPANAALDADITLDQYDVALFWGIPALKTATAGKLNIDVGLNVRWIDLEAKLAYDAGGGITGEDKADVSAPIPMLYVAVQIMPVDSFAFEAEGRGISVGDNKLYSVIGRLRYNVPGPVFVAGGYRYDKLEVDEDDVRADVEFDGPFIELGIHF